MAWSEIEGSGETGMKVAFLLSRQLRVVAADTWWLCAAHAAAGWAAWQGWTLVSGSGILPIDFVCWSYRQHGGAVGAGSNRRERMRDRDRDVIAAADVLVGIAIRRGGIMEEEGKRAIRQGKVVHVAVPPFKQKATFGNFELLNLGARPLELPEFDCKQAGLVSGTGARTSQKRRSLVFICPDGASSAQPPADYLWHYTRACPGPWPGQTPDEYFHSLVQNDPGCGHTGFDTLARILAGQKIRASGKIIRGQYEVVSFSSAPPEDLLARRRFRSTLARWDFEPYAVGVRMAAAKALGVRPVSYLPSSDFARLSTEDRPFFQRSDEDALDWRHENEWRHIGDFDLSAMLPADLAALAPSGEAEQLRRLLTRC